MGEEFSKLNKEISLGIVTAVTTISVSIVANILTKYYVGKWEKDNEVSRQQRDKKIKIYSEFLDMYFKILLPKENTDNKPFTESKEFKEFMSKFTEDLIFWGSYGVINAYADFRRLSVTQDDDKAKGVKLLLQFETILKEIRKDIGHKDKTFKKTTFLTLFINDIQSLMDTTKLSESKKS